MWFRVLCTSFTQETRCWLWPTLPPWRLALAKYKASAPKAPRTLFKWSERSVRTAAVSPSSSSSSSTSISLTWTSCLVADSLLGLLCLWRNGRDRGVAAGRPTHPASDTWTQSQFQLEGNANARLKDWLAGSLSFGTGTAEKIFIFNPPFCYRFSPTTKNKKKHTKKHAWLPSKTSCKKMLQMYSDALLRNEKQFVLRWQQKWATNGAAVAFPSMFHFFAQKVEGPQDMWTLLDGWWWVTFYATRSCQLSVAPPPQAAALKCLWTASFSHTVIRNRWERLIRNIFYMCQKNYYLTCSYEPPAKKAQKKCWQSEQIIVSGAEVGSLRCLFHSCKCHTIRWFS